MKCTQCNKEFDGMFCPECGAKAEEELSAATPLPTKSTQKIRQKQKKKKKPFFLRCWFILLAVIIIIASALSLSGGGEKIEWQDLVLGEMLPEPPQSKGKKYTNTAESLSLDINGVSDKNYANYVAECKAKGFTADPKVDSYSYEAYNSDGYKLILSHYGSDEELSIQLYAPMEMSTIAWPTGVAGQQIPTPNSATGNISYENEDGFHIYVGNTSKAEYDEYVNSCIERGFTVDYDKYENIYSAENADGWELYLEYEGNNIMSVEIDAPEEDEAEETEKQEKETEKPETDAPETIAPETTARDDGSISPDFKAAMDSYESFMNEYVDFMKKYNADPTDIRLLADYANYMSKYADFIEAFEKWETEDMTTAETAYYIDVQARVNKKLLEVTN